MGMMSELSPELSETGDAEYEITKVYAGKTSPLEVQVSFVLDAPGWCKLQQSETWHRFLEVLASVQGGKFMEYNSAYLGLLEDELRDAQARLAQADPESIPIITEQIKEIKRDIRRYSAILKNCMAGGLI